MKFTVFGKPKPLQRARKAHWGGFYDPSKKDKELIAAGALAARIQSRGRIIEGDVMMTVGFYFSDKKRRDLDNLVKLVWDALNEVIFHDDSQICRLLASKEHCEPGQERTEVEIIGV